MIGSTQSWIRNEPEAAIHLFTRQKENAELSERKNESSIPDSETVGDSFSRRIADRCRQLEQSLKHWNDTVPRYKEEGSKQIATELKRQRDAVARYKQARRPRPGSFAYIPKTVWETKDKLDVLTSSGVSTAELQEEQKEVQKSVLELLESMDVAELAKSTNTPRDAYRREDRPAIETVRLPEHGRTQHPDLAADRIVMPAQSWVQHIRGKPWTRRRRKSSRTRSTA